MKQSLKIGLLSAAALTLLALFAQSAYAAKNLAMVATDATCDGKPVKDACGGTAQTGQVYRAPLDTDLVRVLTQPGITDYWASNFYQWKLWTKVQPGDQYDTCFDDIPSGSPVPGGPCMNWGMFPRAILNLPANSAFLSWTPATTNEDGSPYTNPKGYFIYSGQLNPPTTKSALITPQTVISKQYDNLAVGTWYFGITSVNANDVESAKSVIGSKVIASAAPKPTVTMSVTPKDNISTATPTITWGSTNATGCVASGGWTGAKATSGSAVQPKITANTTYTLACSGAGGTTTISSDVNVSPRPGAPAVTIK